ncbi:hypothetical protein B0H13DRAFT_1851525 [Mycena leptocephala]|nr:hypothetical protein B0H13DRAFT_1851525 [Mycena leptocephala]
MLEVPRSKPAQMFLNELLIGPYRDLWEWILDIVSDPTLADLLLRYPVEKYVREEEGLIVRLYDDLNTGKQWWDVQDKLPAAIKRLWPAVIRMSVDGSDKAIAAAMVSELEGETDDEAKSSPDNEPPLYADAHWKLGSPVRLTT